MNKRLLNYLKVGKGGLPPLLLLMLLFDKLFINVHRRPRSLLPGELRRMLFSC